MVAHHLVTLLAQLLSQFFYGYPARGWLGGSFVMYCTPVYALGDACDWNAATITVGEITSTTGEWYLASPATVAAYAAAGVVLAVLALMVYRYRHVESAGDVVSIALVRPVFKYGVALCAGLCFGTWTAAFFGWVDNTLSLSLTLCVLFWAAAGYFAAEMLLKKSFRVLRAWKGGVVTVAALAVLCACCAFDVFGVVNRVPDAQDVAALTVSGNLGGPYDSGTLQLSALNDTQKIALFTDLHTGTQPRNRRLIRRMVALINREHPDMVVNAGDLVNIDSHELDDRVMSILSTLHGRDGVYSVLGNHDLGFYMRPKENFTPRQSVEELLAKQRAMGWKPLVNESAPIRRGADSILVTGVNFPETGTNHGRDTGMAGCDMQEVFRSVPPDTYNLLLAHTPEQWDEARSAGDPDLTLSGHVHAMQFKLTLGPWSWSPAKFLYERWSGLYSENGKHLYINDGMGYVMYPMRIGTTPSITVITLESEKRR